MIGKITSTIIFLFCITYMVTLIMFYFMHLTIKENINQLNYNVVEAVSTGGVLTADMYDYLKENINKFGDYTIKLKFEKKVKAGVYNTYFDKADIVDADLRLGDRITIYVEDKNTTLFGKLINSTILIFKPDKYRDIKIRSSKTGMVSKTYTE